MYLTIYKFIAVIAFPINSVGNEGYLVVVITSSSNVTELHGTSNKEVYLIYCGMSKVLFYKIGTKQEYYMLFWTNPESNTPQNSSSMDTYLPSNKPSK